VLGGPLLALLLLVWSLLLKQETGTSALSSEWKLVTFMIVGICLFVIAYAFLLHALAG
jgi:succinate dehydrogenase/fumarate reductase cytochrome b subunit